MRFAEINLFGVYIAPISVMMLTAWLVVIALRLGLGLLEGDPIVGRIDLEQHLVLVHELVVCDRELDDSSGHLGRHRDDIGPHSAVARPRRTHVNLPSRQGEEGRNCDRT